MGFSDFRVRWLDGAAKLQLTEAQLPLLLEKRGEVLRGLKRYYDGVVLDLEVRDA